MSSSISLLPTSSPKGEVARSYDMYIEKHGTNERGFVVIDSERQGQALAQVAVAARNPGGEPHR